MRRNIVLSLALGLGFALIGFSCAKNNDTAAATERHLYVASGACNSGAGITTYTSTNSSRLVSTVGLDTKKQEIFFDLGAPYQGGYFAPETGAQAVLDDGDQVLVLTENAINAGDRNVFKVPKTTPFNASSIAPDHLAFTSASGDVTRALVVDADDKYLFSKSNSIERIGVDGIRIPGPGANPWISALTAGSCASSNTLISSLVPMAPFTGTTQGKLIFAHNGGSAAANRIGILSRQGGTTATTPSACVFGQTISAATYVYDTGVTGTTPITISANGASPTALTYIPTPSGTSTGKLLVGYSASTSASTDMSNATNLNYAIVMYDVNESSDTVATIGTTATVLYNDFSVIFGISAMTYDSATGNLYVATASQPGIANQTTQSYAYKIEKFKLDLNATGSKLTLIRDATNKPFIERSSLTKCITGMAVGN